MRFGVCLCDLGVCLPVVDLAEKHSHPPLSKC
jgi:hypothetical protein